MAVGNVHAVHAKEDVGSATSSVRTVRMRMRWFKVLLATVL